MTENGKINASAASPVYKANLITRLAEMKKTKKTKKQGAVAVQNTIIATYMHSPTPRYDTNPSISIGNVVKG